jgi:tight adherence protein B
MDWGFLLVAVAVMMPFGLLVAARTLKEKRQRHDALNVLMKRVGMMQSQRDPLEDSFAQQREKPWFIWLSAKFKQAGIRERKEIVQLLVVQAILLFVSVFVLATRFNTLNEKLVFLSILLPLLPALYLVIKIHKRQTQMRKEFPEMLDSIVRSLHSGYGIDGAIAAVGEDMNGYLAEEMRELNKQLTLGISMRDLLREFQRRVDLPEAQFFVITLIIQRETGGQLSMILTELAKLMRRREHFQAKLKTLTAESRFTAWFIGGAPVLYIGYKYFFDQESMQFFLHDPTGVKLFVVSLALIVTGGLILQRMLKMRF